MDVELSKELSETELHQISGGSAGRAAEIAVDSIDEFWNQFLESATPKGAVSSTTLSTRVRTISSRAGPVEEGGAAPEK